MSLVKQLALTPCQPADDNSDQLFEFHEISARLSIQPARAS
jgi:hypothetical protein